jgi:amidase
VAYSTKIPPGILTSLDADAARALSETVELLRSLGHEVREVDPGYGFDVIPAVLARMLRGIRDQSALMAHPERLERRTKTLARIGGLLPDAALDWSYTREATIRDRLGRVFADHDVLLTPATAKPPPRIGQLEGRGGVWTLNAVAGMVPYNAPWNLTGQPACSVPAGLGGDRLPRAVQIVGRVGDEATLLSLAAEIEAERPWAGSRPPLFS